METEDAFDALAESLAYVKSVFGDYVDHILKIDRRAKAPPFGETRHRLAVLIDLAEKTLATRSKPVPIANMPAIVELGIAASLLKKWEHDPIWPELVSAASDKTSFPHFLHVLLCASQFPDQHVAFQSTLQSTRGGTRSADLIIVFEPSHELAVEVKAPKKLQGTQPALDGKLSEKEILRLVRKADDRAGGQLGPGRSSLLAIGGFHLGRKDLENLRKGITNYFDIKGNKRRHLYGIMIITLGALFDNLIIEADGTIKSGNNTRVRSFSRAQLTLNPYYKGPIVVNSFLCPDADLESATEIRTKVKSIE